MCVRRMIQQEMTELVPDDNPVLSRGALLDDGRAFVRLLADASPTVAGGDTRPFTAAARAELAGKSKREQERVAAMPKAPFSTTLFVCAMDNMSDLALARPATRACLLPALLRMQSTSVPDLGCYTDSKLKIQRLAMEEAEVGREIREQREAAERLRHQTSRY